MLDGWDFDGSQSDRLFASDNSSLIDLLYQSPNAMLHLFKFAIELLVGRSSSGRVLRNYDVASYKKLPIANFRVRLLCTTSYSVV